MTKAGNLRYLNKEHISSLKLLSDFLTDCLDPWWVLGSAAIALCGVNPSGVRDIDVLVSSRDSERLMQLHDLENSADGGNSLFRSDTFLLPELGTIRVEIMSNYEISSNSGWKKLAPLSRLAIILEDTTLFVPNIQEQIEILHALGRPKDLKRAEGLSLAL